MSLKSDKCLQNRLKLTSEGFSTAGFRIENIDAFQKKGGIDFCSQMPHFDVTSEDETRVKAIDFNPYCISVFFLSQVEGNALSHFKNVGVQLR